MTRAGGHTRTPAALRAALAGLAVLAATACAGGVGAGGETATGDLTVFAAASLTGALPELGERFTAGHPGVDVRFNFAGSQQLAGQILEGAPADVFASADAAQMERVAAAGRLDGPAEVFATNDLMIAVEAGNPLAITGLEDLARPDLISVLAAEEVPLGAYTREALDRAGIAVTPASLELDARAVVAKVALGEADAGLAYRSDVTAAGGRVDGVALPPGHNVRAAYHVAVVEGAADPQVARDFSMFLRSPEAAAVLARSGLERP